MELVKITPNSTHYIGEDAIFHIKEFCEMATKADPDPYVQKNMAVRYWSKNSSSLLYRCFIAKTIKFVTIVDNIHISGVEPLNKNVAIIAKRHFQMPHTRLVDPEKRPRPLTEFAIPEQVEWCKENDFKIVCVTYNKGLEKVANIHRRWIAGKYVPGLPMTDFPDSPLLKMKEYPELVNINGEDQYVFYWRMDKRYKLDFTKG